MNKPTVLSTGEWLFPIAIWLPDYFTEFRKPGMQEDDLTGSYVYKTSDCGKTFQKLGMANVRNRSYDEHMVYEQQNGVLKMLIRTTYGTLTTAAKIGARVKTVVWADPVPVFILDGSNPEGYCLSTTTSSPAEII